MTEETKSQTPDEAASPSGEAHLPQETTPAPASIEANASTPSSDSSDPAAVSAAEPDEGGAHESATRESAAHEGEPGEGEPGESAPSEHDSDEDASASDESGTGDGAKKKKRKRKRKKKNPGESERAHERAPFRVGEEVFGKVTAVLDTAIMIDLSGKALAIFDRGEMEPDDLVPEVGDRFVGQVLGDGARGGLVVLTRKPLREEEAKPKAEAAAKDGSLINCLVTGVIKGGVEVVFEGLRAFAPASGVDLHPRTANLTTLVGTRLDFKVANYEKQGREVVVTRRPMLEKEAHERRKKAREVLQEGAEMEGVVRTVVEWGAFVALPEAENLEGLVHISEVSHNPRERIADVLKPGQKIKVRIEKIDDKGKIWLSRKALIEDPFTKLIEGIKQGDVIEGEVTRVEEFGAFIKIAEGFEGLCHAADLSIERVEDVRKLLEPGQKLKVVVHHIDSRQRRVALHPALPDEQAGEERQKVAKNAKLKVEIVKVDKPGLVVRVLGATGRQARGFIPAGQTGTARGAELRKHFNKGDKLEVMVVDIDPKRGEAKLSVSRLSQDEERRAHKEYRQKLQAESKFGTLGDLLKQKLGS
jgi:ribosomal protein S1